MHVVIDKSYLQGVSADQLHRLCAEHTVLFAETLLYELLTTEEESERNACLAKFPQTDDCVVLIPRTGPLFQHEMQHRRPASPLVDHHLDAPFRGLVAGVLSRPLDEDPTLAGWRLEVEREVNRFDEVATGISAWCPALLNAPGSELREACDSLKQQACSDPDVVRKIYQSLGLEEFPPGTLLEPNWALFRYVQMHLLFGLDHIRRYGFTGYSVIPRRVEHDVHDLQYAMYGTLSGAVATRDSDVERNFALACPAGVVLS